MLTRTLALIKLGWITDVVGFGILAAISLIQLIGLSKKRDLTTPKPLKMETN